MFPLFVRIQTIEVDFLQYSKSSDLLFLFSQDFFVANFFSGYQQ